MSPSGKRIGLVVGAGGPTGGPFMYAALDELQLLTSWDPSSAETIVGTSAGAFVAARLAPSTASTTDEQWEALIALANGESFGPRPLDRVVSGIRRGIGVLVAIFTPTRRHFAEYRVPPRPYHQGSLVVTVQRRPGRRVVHRLVGIDDAEAVVRASAAIPLANRPVEVDGSLHVDGAVHSAANADVLAIEDHDAIIVLAPMIGVTGGSVVTRFHRAQLRHQLRPWVRAGYPTLVVLPSESEHRDRRNVETFEPAGRSSVRRLCSEDKGH